MLDLTSHRRTVSASFTYRSIHAIDLQNLLGGTEASHEEIVNCFHLWSAHVVGVKPGDRVVVATSHRMAHTAWFALPAQGIQRVVRSGPDGADLALLDAIDLDRDARRFSRLIIGSGDGIFASLATAAASQGVLVEQIVGRGGNAAALASACANTIQLPLGACTHSQHALDLAA